MVKSPVVGVRSIRFEITETSSKPEMTTAMRMSSVSPFGIPSPTAHASDASAFQTGNLGKVDIETYILSQPMGQHVASYLKNDIMIGREIALTVASPQAIPNGRESLHTSFDDSPNSATVVEAYAGIVSVVDATDHEVRTTRTDLLKGQFHTVNGCSTAGHNAEVRFASHLAQLYRTGGSYGTGCTRASTIGSHHDNVTQGLHQFGQFSDALCLVSIVVGNEYEFPFVHVCVEFYLQK